MSFTSVLLLFLVAYGSLSLWADLASFVRRLRGFDEEVRNRPRLPGAPAGAPSRLPKEPPLVRTITTEVDVECDALHCEDGDCAPCPDEHVEQFEGAIAAAFREHGPADERFCEWRKCMVEPWRSLAQAMGTK